MTFENQYLTLAYAMELTRGDWSNGCYRVKNALGKFEIITSLDRQIYNEINELVSEWGLYQDGRVFRDCEFNYNFLKGLALPEELELYEENMKKRFLGL